MRLSLSFGVAILLGLVSAASHAQTVQSTISISLTAEFSVPTSNGSKIYKGRLSTRDLIDEYKYELGIPGNGGSLVIRRQIDDFESPGETLLIVNKVAYTLPDEPIGDIDVEMPASYFAYVEAVKLRRSDGAESEIKSLEPIAFRLGDLDVDGFEMTLVGIEKVTLKLLTQSGVDLGYLVAGTSSTVAGGMLDIDYGSAVVTGKLSSSSEKIVP
jgi:hypothetical protein